MAVKRMLDNVGNINIAPIYGCYIESNKVSNDEDGNETGEKVVHLDFYFDGQI